MGIYCNYTLERHWLHSLGGAAGQALPPVDDDARVVRVELDAGAVPAGLLARDDARAAPAEHVEDGLAASRAVHDLVREQAHGLHCRVQLVACRLVKLQHRCRALLGEQVLDELD